ncbi:MAG: LL-diaminopimelate aminotransferase [Candidatus Glassbacteria bacterium]|nr:LL-diaminopimelate aminotransferase [Candidatus Glassbacteria bacterium]
MAGELVQQFFAQRIGGENFGRDDTVYKFEKIKRAKRAAIKDHPGVELIDLGVGEPDGMTPAPIVEALRQEAQRYENRGYTDNGIGEFREAVAWHMEHVYGVGGLDPATQINHSIGSKSALALLPSALVDPGDVVLMTVPGYPVFGTHSAWYGAEVVNLPLTEDNGFLPDLDSLDEETARRAKVLVINYPNNPTGRAATEDFFRGVIDWAHRYEVAIIQDAAYAALVYGRKPLSILSIDGAMDVAIELHSLSKSYNMTGWRIGWVCGNAGLVQAFAEVKDHSDSGQFAAIQKAAAVGLRNPQLTGQIAGKYERKLKLLCGAFEKLGYETRMPEGTFYLFMKSPRGIEGGPEFQTAEACSQWLIREQLISTVPEDTAGAFLRAGATFIARDEEDEKRIAGEIGNRLSGSKFVF